MGIIQPFQNCIDKLEQSAVPPAGGKKLYFQLREGQLDLTENSKNRANLRDVAAYIDTKMQDALKNEALDPDALAKLKKVEDFYNRCEERRVQKATGSFWSWIIRLFKPKEYFVEKRLNHNLEPLISLKRQALEEQQILEHTKDKVLSIAHSVQQLIVSSRIIQRAAPLGIELPQLRHNLEQEIRHASGSELARLEKELALVNTKMRRAIEQVGSKEKALHAQIQVAAVSSEQIKAAAANLAAKAHDAPEALLELGQKAALHIEMEPHFQEFVEGVAPLLEAAKALQNKIANYPQLAELASRISLLTAACIRLPIRPETLTQEKIAALVGQKEALDQELHALQEKAGADIQEIEKRFEAEKLEAIALLTQVKAAKAQLKYPVPALDERIKNVEARLQEKRVLFDAKIPQEIAQIREEIAKRVATLPNLEATLHYTALAQKIDPKIPNSLALSTWQQTGEVDDLQLIKKSHKAALLPVLFQTRLLKELVALLDHPWIQAVDGTKELQHEIDAKVHVLYLDILDTALNDLHDQSFRSELETRFKREISGKRLDECAAWESSLRAQILKCNNDATRKQKLAEAAKNYTSLFPLLQEIAPSESARIQQAKVALQMSPGSNLQSIPQEIAQLEAGLDSIIKELTSAKWQELAKDSKELQKALKEHNLPAIQGACEALIQKKNEESAKLQEVQTTWNKTRIGFLAQIAEKRLEYAKADVKNRLARELLASEEARIKAYVLPTSLSLDLERQLRMFQASLSHFSTDFKSKLEADFKAYSEGNRSYARSKSEAETLLTKATHLRQSAALLSQHNAVDLGSQLGELEALVKAPLDELSIRKKAAEMNALSAQISEKAALFKRLVEKETHHLEGVIRERQLQFLEGFTACRKMCKNKEFRSAVAVPKEIPANKPLVEQAKMVTSLAQELKAAQKIQQQDELFSQYQDKKAAVFQTLSPLLEEILRLEECFTSSGALKQSPEAEKLLQLREQVEFTSNTLRKEAALAPSAEFETELNRRTAALKKAADALPLQHEECRKAKEAFDAYAKKELQAIQDEVNKTTELLKRIETKKEGFQEKLVKLQGRLSEARGANWAAELAALGAESRALNASLLKVFEVAQKAFEASRNALGEVEKAMLKQLSLTEASLQDQNVVRMTLQHAVKALPKTEDPTVKARSSLIEKELAGNPIQLRRALRLLFELQHLAEKPSAIATVVQLRELMLQIQAKNIPIPPAASKLIREFFQTDAAGLQAHILDPNQAQHLKGVRVEVFKKELLAALPDGPEVQSLKRKIMGA